MICSREYIFGQSYSSCSNLKEIILHIISCREVRVGPPYSQDNVYSVRSLLLENGCLYSLHWRTNIYIL